MTVVLFENYTEFNSESTSKPNLESNPESVNSLTDEMDDEIITDATNNTNDGILGIMSLENLEIEHIPEHVIVPVIEDYNPLPFLIGLGEETTELKDIYKHVHFFELLHQGDAVFYCYYNFVYNTRVDENNIAYYMETDFVDITFQDDLSIRVQLSGNLYKLLEDSVNLMTVNNESYISTTRAAAFMNPPVIFGAYYDKKYLLFKSGYNKKLEHFFKCYKKTLKNEIMYIFKNGKFKKSP